MDKGKPVIDYNMTKEERKKALDAAIAQIEKNYGKGSIMKLNESHVTAVEVIPTGCLSVDLALGIGGLPRGRIVEIYGPESSGKTTLSLHVIAQAQKMGGTVAFIDAEHALDPVYARNLGIDTDNLLVSQPDNGEQGLDIAEALVRSGGVDVVVVDSVAALTPKAEIDGEMGDSFVGVQARLMSAAMRKLTAVISKSDTVAIFINQIREKIGVMYGNPETTPGGRALKFYASVRIEVRRGEAIKDGDKIIGSRTKCKVVKNKVAPPFKSCEFDMIYGQGISKMGEIIDMGVELKIIKKSGSWFSYNDMKIGQGRESVKKWLTENEDIRSEVEVKIRDQADALFKTLLSGGADDDMGEGSDGQENPPAEDEIPAPESEEAPAKKSTAKSAPKKSKKTVVIEAEEDFEEFSIDEIDGD